MRLMSSDMAPVPGPTNRPMNALWIKYR